MINSNIIRVFVYKKEDPEGVFWWLDSEGRWVGPYDSLKAATACHGLYAQNFTLDYDRDRLGEL